MGFTRFLEHFRWPPREIDFKRQFTDSPALVARYRRSLEGFASFLRECGDLAEDEDQEQEVRTGGPPRNPK